MNNNRRFSPVLIILISFSVVVVGLVACFVIPNKIETRRLKENEVALYNKIDFSGLMTLTDKVYSPGSLDISDYWQYTYTPKADRVTTFDAITEQLKSRGFTILYRAPSEDYIFAKEATPKNAVTKESPNSRPSVEVILSPEGEPPFSAQSGTISYQPVTPNITKVTVILSYYNKSPVD